MYLFLSATVTKYHRCGWHNTTETFFHSSQGKKFKIKVLVSLVPSLGVRGRICPMPLSELPVAADTP